MQLNKKIKLKSRNSSKSSLVSKPRKAGNDCVMIGKKNLYDDGARKRKRRVTVSALGCVSTTARLIAQAKRMMDEFECDSKKRIVSLEPALLRFYFP